jgi:hypothetical protein
MQKKESQELDEMWARFTSGRTALWATQYRIGFVAADIRRRIEKYDERYVYADFVHMNWWFHVIFYFN